MQSILKIQYTYIWLGCILIGLSCQQTETSPKPPNILFIMADDLGKEWVSCYGAEDIQTPHIDQLAAQGLLFENAWSMPQCTPTRLTLLTGQYPFRHGWVNHWDVPRWGGGCHYDWRKNASIGRVMQSAGYKTAVAGKWQVNDFRVQPDAMTQHGFDDYAMWTGYEGGNPPSGERYWDPYIFTKEGSKTYEGQFGEDIFTDFLIDFMQKNREHPMFMYYPMCLPHGPLVATPEDPDLENDKMKRYTAMVRYVDEMVGKLLTALEEQGLKENTLVIFTTDNGSGRGITGKMNGREVQGGKGETVEPGICEPFIASGPGVPKGKRTQAITDFTDLFPTFAELGGAQIPDSIVLDGKSIVNVLEGKSEVADRRWIMSMGGKNRARLTEQGAENEHYFRDRVLRNERFKLYVGTDRQPEKLIDLQADPDETNNLLGSDEPAIQAAMKIFSEAISQFPVQDADPQYIPLKSEPWDVPITAKSQVWKLGHPDYDENAILKKAMR